MKPLSPEEKADYALEMFEGIKPAEPSVDFDSKMFARFDSEFFVKSKTPKWFWAAAIAILAVNILAAYNYSGSRSTAISSETKTTNAVGSYYFQGGTDWFQE